jgi:integrase
VITERIKYLVRQTSRHGKEVFYVRVPGAKRKVRIREEFGTSSFWEAYSEARAALAGEHQVSQRRRRDKGTVNWLIALYYNSQAWAALSATTQTRRRAMLDEFTAVEITVAGERTPIGRAATGKITPKLLKKLRDRWSKKGPYVATNRLKAVRHVWKWAFDQELVERDVARDVKLLKPKTAGWHSWTLDELDRFIERWPVGTAPYVAMAVLLGTGGRRGDAYRIGPANIYLHRPDGAAGREEWIKFTPAKTAKSSGVVVDIPMVGFLREALDAGPTHETAFVVGVHGRPFKSAASFGGEFKEWCRSAGLPHCSAHGLRKAGAAFLAERSGATPNQLLAIFGWTTLEQAEVYTRAAERRKLSAVLSTLKLREVAE